jgi:hypothetical protein
MDLICIEKLVLELGQKIKILSHDLAEGMGERAWSETIDVLIRLQATIWNSPYFSDEGRREFDLTKLVQLLRRDADLLISERQGDSLDEMLSLVFGLGVILEHAEDRTLDEEPLWRIRSLDDIDRLRELFMEIQRHFEAIRQFSTRLGIRGRDLNRELARLKTFLTASLRRLTKIERGEEIPEFIPAIAGTPLVV